MAAIGIAVVGLATTRAGAVYLQPEDGAESAVVLPIVGTVEAMGGRSLPPHLPEGSRIVPGRVLLKVRSGVDVDRFLRENGLILLDTEPAIGMNIIEVPAGQEFAWSRRLARFPEVAYAEPDGKAYAMTIANDPLFSYHQWYLSHIEMPAAWDRFTGTADITIAILDTGIDADHEDLRGKIVPGYNAIRKTNVVVDDVGHGTHVAGLAAAISDNRIGIAGVSWGAKVMPVKVLNAVGEGANSAVAGGIVWAVDNGAKVLNLSLGSSSGNSALSDAIRYARNRNRLVVAAMGNDYLYGNPTMYPAAMTGVMAVGASSSSDGRARYSQTGNHLSVLAPGGDPNSEQDSNNEHWIISTWRTADGTKYRTLAGTSQATPLVSGLAALIWSYKPDMTAVEVRDLIERTAVDLGAEGRDRDTGYGRINPRAAMEALTLPDADADPPVISVTFPAQDAFVSGVVSIQGSVEDAGLKSIQTQYGIGAAPSNWYNIGRAGTQVVTNAEIASWSTEGLVDGIYTLRVIGTDHAGNITTTEPVRINVDNTPPDLALISPTEGQSIGTRALLTGTLLEKNLAGYEILLGVGGEPEQWANLLTRDTVPSSGEPIGDVTISDQPAGSYVLRILATDKAGNSSEARVQIIHQTLTAGDVNGDGKRNVQDATLLLRVIIGTATLEPVQAEAADINKDGRLNIQDATMILRAAVGSL